MIRVARRPEQKRQPGGIVLGIVILERSQPRGRVWDVRLLAHGHVRNIGDVPKPGKVGLPVSRTRESAGIDGFHRSLEGAGWPAAGVESHGNTATAAVEKSIELIKRCLTLESPSWRPAAEQPSLVIVRGPHPPRQRKIFYVRRPTPSGSAIREMRAVLGQITIHGHFISRLQRVLPPAAPPSIVLTLPSSTAQLTTLPLWSLTST